MRGQPVDHIPLIASMYLWFNYHHNLGTLPRPYQHASLWDLQRDMGIGIMGFGAHSRIHTVKIERLSEDLPIIVEIVDEREKLEAFLGEIDSAITEGVATMEKAFVKFYRSGK